MPCGITNTRLEGKTITLKLRYADFRTITRSHTLDTHTDITKTLLEEAETVFENWYKSSASKLRLLGFGVSNLRKKGTGQQSLFIDENEKKQKNIDEVLDKIKEKYGDDALKRG